MYSPSTCSTTSRADGGRGCFWNRTPPANSIVYNVRQNLQSCSKGSSGIRTVLRWEVCTPTIVKNSKLNGGIADESEITVLWVKQGNLPWDTCGKLPDKLYQPKSFSPGRWRSPRTAPGNSDWAFESKRRCRSTSSHNQGGYDTSRWRSQGGQPARETSTRNRVRLEFCTWSTLRGIGKQWQILSFIR